jgi:hypothetical protein
MLLAEDFFMPQFLKISNIKKARSYNYELSNSLLKLILIFSVFEIINKSKAKEICFT